MTEIRSPIKAVRDKDGYHSVRMSSLADDLEEASHTSYRPGSPAAFRQLTQPKEERPVSKLIWEEPPLRLNTSKPPEWLDELRSRPGEWAIVIPDAKTAGTAASLKKRFGLEAVARRNETGRFRIFARFPVVAIKRAV